MKLSDFQTNIKKAFYDKDSKRGLDGTFMYFIEEVGELATSLREESKEHQAGEFADVAAWLVSLANLAGVDLEQAILAKYPEHCIRCGKSPCECETKN